VSLRRIEAAVSEGRSLTAADRHELYENALMAQGMDYESAHDQALAELGHSPPAVDAIGGLLKGELVEVGDVVRGEGFHTWDLAPSAALQRIEQEWRALGRDPFPGDIGWLQNTPGGDRRAEEILAERGGRT
jgi:hypothetical protein